MGQLDEAEYARLEAQVLGIERLVAGGLSGGTELLLRNFLSNAKSRMEEIRQDQGMDGESKKDRRERETAMAVELAEREHRLSAQEKERYSGFLELDYFTRTDFEELETFYTDSWDRLSEGGKNQMSVRVWGGVRRHEYTFEELPEKMREKESERVYQQLTGAIEANTGLRNVAPQARTEFIREYEAGNEKAATQILSGSGFAGYSPDTRKEESGPDASLALKKETAGTPETKNPQVTEDLEATLEGFTPAAAEPVPPSHLPVSAGSPPGKS